MDRLKPVDVAIIGGGWNGLLIAKEIASRTSLSVVVLERGGPRKTADYATQMDELDYSIRMRMMQSIADETVTHRHSSGERAAPMRQYGAFNPGTGVGGAGEHWGGVSNRFLPEQFVLATHLREKYGSSKLPENLAVQDWGITWDEIEPYYWRAEQMMGVNGKAGNLQGKHTEGGNIFEGPRSHEYPNPPHKMTYWTTMFQKAAVDLGYHPYPVPTATLSQNYKNPDGVARPGCMYCGYCGRYGCMIGAKAQPTNTLMPLLARKANFHLETGCWVNRVIHRGDKVEGVSYTDASGQEKMQPADVVIVASWTLNNSRLLLLSQIGEPYDPVTGKGTLGKNFTHSLEPGLEVFFDKPLNNFMGAGGLGTTIADFEGDHGLDASSGILVGGVIRALSGGDGPIASFGSIPRDETKSNWGSEWKKAALRWNDKVQHLSCVAEHMSYRQNYVDLDPTYTDKFGDPLLRLTLDWTEHERRQTAFMAKIQLSLAKAMGGKPGALRNPGDHYTITQYQSTHVQGGVIMGDSPERSVVNTWLQHWHFPNLWVLGGSAFPQNGTGNPTLTMLALTYRAADGFVDRYIKKPGALA